MFDFELNRTSSNADMLSAMNYPAGAGSTMNYLFQLQIKRTLNFVNRGI